MIVLAVLKSTHYPDHRLVATSLSLKRGSRFLQVRDR